MIAVARRLVRGVNSLLPRPRGGVVVLTYHLVGAGTSSPVDVPLDMFREQIAWLASSGRVVPLAAALDLLASGRATDEAQVVLTFDDAYENFHRVAWPVLRAAGLPATLYVPVDFLDGAPSPIRNLTLPPCTWSQLRQMVAEGLAVGSHTFAHRDLRACAPDELERDVRGSRRALEDRLQVAVDSFCYPRGLWSRAAERLVTQTYRSAVVSGGRRARPDRWAAHRLERVPVRSDLPSLSAVVAAEVWLEERIATVIRQARR